MKSIVIVPRKLAAHSSRCSSAAEAAILTFKVYDRKPPYAFSGMFNAARSAHVPCSPIANRAQPRPPALRRPINSHRFGRIASRMLSTRTTPDDFAETSSMILCTVERSPAD